jgi:hypothetical protein
MRSQFKSKPIRQAHGFATSGETSDWGERSISPSVPLPRRLPSQPQMAVPQAQSNGSHIVIHDYTSQDGAFSLYIGDRLHIVDNGDPDWLHGFRTNDRLQQLLTFPATCVASIQPHEQPMKLLQNVVRLY